MPTHQASNPLRYSTFTTFIHSTPLNPWHFSLKSSSASVQGTQYSSPGLPLLHHLHTVSLQPAQLESHGTAGHVLIRLASAALMTEMLHVTVKSFRLGPSLDLLDSSMKRRLRTRRLVSLCARDGWRRPTVLDWSWVWDIALMKFWLKVLGRSASVVSHLRSHDVRGVSYIYLSALKVKASGGQRSSNWQVCLFSLRAIPRSYSYFEIIRIYQ